MKGKALLSLIIILVIIIAAGVAWFYVVPNFRKPKIIKFGCAVSLSGKYKKEGEMLKAGIDLWKDLVNEKGGIKVKGKNYNAPIEMDGDSWVLCANLFQVVLDSEGIKYSKKGDVLLKCRELYHGEGVEICWHYSIAVLDSENIELGKWYEITISLEQLAIQMENELGFKINKTHLIQPFIETCGGEIEAYFDVVKLY